MLRPCRTIEIRAPIHSSPQSRSASCCNRHFSSSTVPYFVQLLYTRTYVCITIAMLRACSTALCNAFRTTPPHHQSSPGCFEWPALQWAFRTLAIGREGGQRGSREAPHPRCLLLIRRFCRCSYIPYLFHTTVLYIRIFPLYPTVHTRYRSRTTIGHRGKLLRQQCKSFKTRWVPQVWQ